MVHDSHRVFLPLFLAEQQALFAFALARGVPPSEADDLVQDVAVIAWEKFDNFTIGSNFRAWLFQIARFAILRRIEAGARQRRVLRLDAGAEDRLIALATEGPESALPADLLQGCLQRLGQRARELLRLRYEEGLSPSALAEELGESAGAVRVRLHRIRQQLLACIQRRELEELTP